MEQDFTRPGAYNLLGSGSGSLGNGMNKSINPPGRGRALSSSARKSQGELGFSLVAAGLGAGPSAERFGIPGTARDGNEPLGWGENHPGTSPGTLRVLGGNHGVLNPQLQGSQTSRGSWSWMCLLPQRRFWEWLGFIPDPSPDHRVLSVLLHCTARS